MSAAYGKIMDTCTARIHRQPDHMRGQSEFGGRSSSCGRGLGTSRWGWGWALMHEWWPIGARQPSATCCTELAQADRPPPEQFNDFECGFIHTRTCICNSRYIVRFDSAGCSDIVSYHDSQDTMFTVYFSFPFYYDICIYVVAKPFALETTQRAISVDVMVFGVSQCRCSS